MNQTTPGKSTPTFGTTWNDAFPHWGHPISKAPLITRCVGEGPRDEEEWRFARRVESSPKIELHVHLEAAVPVDFYARLNERQGLFPPENLPHFRGPFASLRDFITAWIDASRLIDTPSLYRDLVLAFAANRASQAIVYSEVHVSPVDMTVMRERFKWATPLDFGECLAALLEGAREARALYPQVEMRFIVDFLWFTEEAERLRMLESFDEVCGGSAGLDPEGEPWVVGVGLGGAEDEERATTLGSWVKACRTRGLALDVHTGEGSHARGMRRSLDALAPSRIAHGIAGATEGWFFAGHTATCPLSNLLTGAWKGELATHPVGEMRKRGVAFSVNTDDPLLFGTTLTLEYVALRRALGWDWDVFRESQTRAAQAVFAPRVLQRVGTDLNSPTGA